MPPQLRTRRCSSGGSASSLPSYEIPVGNCPSPLPIDDHSSSEFDTDDIYPVKVMEFRSSSYHPHPHHQPTAPLCRVRSTSTFWKTMALRAVMVAAIFAVVGMNLTEKFKVQGNSNSNNNNNSMLLETADSSTETERTASAVARRLTRETEQIQSLETLADEERIRRTSEKRLVETFGPGPHLVEFELHIWEGTKPTQYFFTVETAPSHLMPAAVYNFLQQVKHGLWSGTSIHLNAEHVIAARPVSGNGQISKRQVFDDSGFGILPFAEYSEGYPHLPYTLGFVGKGPAFYINKRHNHHHDACFANVVIGRSTIDKIGGMRGYDHDPQRIRPVDIVAARIIQAQELNAKATQEYLAASLSNNSNTPSRSTLVKSATTTTTTSTE